MLESQQELNQEAPPHFLNFKERIMMKVRVLSGPQVVRNEEKGSRPLIYVAAEIVSEQKPKKGDSVANYHKVGDFVAIHVRQNAGTMPKQGRTVVVTDGLHPEYLGRRK